MESRKRRPGNGKRNAKKERASRKQGSIEKSLKIGRSREKVDPVLRKETRIRLRKVPYGKKQLLNKKEKKKKKKRGTRLSKRSSFVLPQLR